MVIQNLTQSFVLIAIIGSTPLIAIRGHKYDFIIIQDFFFYASDQRPFPWISQVNGRDPANIVWVPANLPSSKSRFIGSIMVFGPGFISQEFLKETIISNRITFLPEKFGCQVHDLKVSHEIISFKKGFTQQKCDQ